MHMVVLPAMSKSLVSPSTSISIYPHPYLQRHSHRCGVLGDAYLNHSRAKSFCHKPQHIDRLKIALMSAQWVVYRMQEVQRLGTEGDAAWGNQWRRQSESGTRSAAQPTDIFIHTLTTYPFEQPGNWNVSIVSNSIFFTARYYTLYEKQNSNKVKIDLIKLVIIIR